MSKAAKGHFVNNISDDIRNHTFQHVYLLYGEENYLKLQYRDRLAKAILGSGDAMNLNIYEGDHIDEGAVIDQAETLPFFAEHRVIEINRSGFFKGSCEKLPDYMKMIPDYLYFIFTENEVDKRSRLYKAVKSAGSVVEVGEQKESTLTAWVLKMLGDAGLKIRKPVMEFFLSRTGTDMSHIRLELDKVIHYCQEKGKEVVTAEDVTAVTCDRTENRIFDMVTAITQHDRKRTLDYYADLLALKEPPMRILYLIARQYQQLLMISELSAEGKSQTEIASKAKMPSFAVRRNLAIARQYSRTTLQKCISLCVQTEEDVKTGLLDDRLGVELILIRLSANPQKTMNR